MKKYILSFLFMVSLLASGQVFATAQAPYAYPNIYNITDSSATISFLGGGSWDGVSQVGVTVTVDPGMLPYIPATSVYYFPVNNQGVRDKIVISNLDQGRKYYVTLISNTANDSCKFDGVRTSYQSCPGVKKINPESFTFITEDSKKSTFKTNRITSTSAEIMIGYSTRFTNIINEEDSDNLYLVAKYYKKPLSDKTNFSYKILKKRQGVANSVIGIHPQGDFTIENLESDSEYEISVSLVRVQGCAPFIPLGPNMGCGTVANQELANSGTFSFKTTLSQNQSQTLTQKLKLGSRGEQVKILEQFLVDGGYLDIAPDTYFGTSTRKAVQAFQREQGMTPDGSVGPKTRSIINGLLDK